MVSDSGINVILTGRGFAWIVVVVGKRDAESRAVVIGTYLCNSGLCGRRRRNRRDGRDD